MKCDKKGLLLYAVTDRSWLNGETLYSQVEKALQGGATFIQLREKNLDQDHFMEEALELKKLCAAYHVPFVINDNVEIAAKMDADGVHVGQSDMEAGDVRAKLGPDKIIGVSAQTVEQAILAEQRVDFSLFQLKGNMVVCADADEFLHDILHFNDIRQGHPSRIFFRQNASYFAGHAHGVPSGNGSLKPRRGEGAALPRRSSATSYGCAISPKTSCRVRRLRGWPRPCARITR